ncbi:predicted protein [Nematostella vectensis]|uniref:Cysteine/serine-rich nuclear protein N-terminal domain-containing protein n=1 Tax=Nematostella vectensis TaxID=45351 RepID=A7T2E7_NEMVE|nr:cysteine/serine-rich nuclear protein 3 [Nematostella vectensis]EDO29869.1 predicted protein [Nematostella vectensis]|eukprot:XP_001621969.1 hypothetical protein NEMVEDRAFT_v1g248604 [Nematostella vectensis]
MLKRKIEEDSLSESSHESSDSLDSGDSPKSKLPRRVRFYERTVFHFPRTQGSSCVPSNGGYTLGMKRKHSFVESFKFTDYDENLELCFQSESDEDEEDDDDHSFLPIPQKTRKAILKDAGVKKINKQEASECMEIRYSRQICGCDCKTFCDPATCSCSLNGINCQVDRDSFPCGCTRDACRNPQGRHEYDPISVRRHFIDTVLKLRGQKYIWGDQATIDGSTKQSVISFAVS